MSNDPFAGPTAVPSAFASVASFRGRLVIIEPTDFELDVPNRDEPGKKADRITATITVVDGSGDVEIWSDHVGTGQFLPGPAYEGVWISQDRVVKGLRVEPFERMRHNKMTLGRLETYQPGQRPKKGNPWGILPPTAQDRQTALDFLAQRTMAAVAGPTGEDENPFG